MNLFCRFCSFNVYGSMLCLLMHSMNSFPRKFSIASFTSIFIFNYSMNLSMMISFLICSREVYFSLISMQHMGLLYMSFKSSFFCKYFRTLISFVLCFRNLRSFYRVPLEYMTRQILITAKSFRALLSRKSMI